MRTVGAEISLNLVMTRSKITLSLESVPRAGWDEAFAQMHRDGADKLLIPEFENDFDAKAW
jgi:hypothetical protein